MVVVVKQIQSLVKGMRTCIGKSAAVRGEEALPVPTAGIAVELNAYLRKAAENAGSDYFFNLKEVVCKAALLKNEHMAAMLCGSLFQYVEFFDGRNEGLFGEYVEVMLKKVLGDGKMLVAGGSIYNQVYVLAVEYVFVVLKNLTAEFLCGTVAARLKRLNYADDLEAFGIFFQMQTVNIASASALTEYNKA